MCGVLAMENNQWLVFPLAYAFLKPQCKWHCIDCGHVYRTFDGTSDSVVTPHINKDALAAFQKLPHDHRI